ncbi:unnamed protein product [Durusdinium trenchii]|uniref:Uncharacterized protein n=1 Tax=Durusdinium trenchii TaxID=1381693 RepID=A0ABP0PCM3_9DINO
MQANISGKSDLLFQFLSINSNANASSQGCHHFGLAAVFKTEWAATLAQVQVNAMNYWMDRLRHASADHCEGAVRTAIDSTAPLTFDLPDATQNETGLCTRALQDIQKSLWSRVVDISKSMIDLKSAVEKAKNLVSTLTEVRQSISNKEPVTETIVKRVQALSSIKDCKKLLTESEGLSEADASARDSLTQAWDQFQPHVPDVQAEFSKFVKFMNKQWHPGQDGTDFEAGEISLLLSEHETGLLFAEIGRACYAGLVECYVTQGTTLAEQTIALMMSNFIRTLASWTETSKQDPSVPEGLEVTVEAIENPTGAILQPYLSLYVRIKSLDMKILEELLPEKHGLAVTFLSTFEKTVKAYLTTVEHDVEESLEGLKQYRDIIPASESWDIDPVMWNFEDFRAVAAKVLTYLAVGDYIIHSDHERYKEKGALGKVMQFVGSVGMSKADLPAEVLKRLESKPEPEPAPKAMTKARAAPKRKKTAKTQPEQDGDEDQEEENKRLKREPAVEKTELSEPMGEVQVDATRTIRESIFRKLVEALGHSLSGDVGADGIFIPPVPGELMQGLPNCYSYWPLCAGHVDWTTFVDFTNVAAAGGANSLATLFYGPQSLLEHLGRRNLSVHGKSYDVPGYAVFANTWLSNHVKNWYGREVLASMDQSAGWQQRWTSFKWLLLQKTKIVEEASPVISFPSWHLDSQEADPCWSFDPSALPLADWIALQDEEDPRVALERFSLEVSEELGPKYALEYEELQLAVRLVDWLVATEGCQNFKPHQAQRLFHSEGLWQTLRSRLMRAWRSIWGQESVDRVAQAVLKRLMEPTEVSASPVECVGLQTYVALCEAGWAGGCLDVPGCAWTPDPSTPSVSRTDAKVLASCKPNEI